MNLHKKSKNWNDKSSEILVIGVASRPMDLEKSVLVYLPLRLLVRTPDNIIRHEILKKFVEVNNIGLEREHLKDLIKQTEYFSVFELNVLLSNVLAVRMREIHEREGAEQLVDASQLRPIEYDDFCLALRQIRAVFSWSESTSEFEDWNNLYGSRID